LLLPTAVAVPEITPVEALRDNPSGRVPALSDHVSGPTPPEAERVVEKATPTTGLGRLEETTESSGLMTMLVGKVALCAGEEESVTRKVKFEVPADSGTPEIAPVEALRPRPEGNAPTEMVHVRGAVPPETVGIKL
jgi:hypothetical protein